MNNNSCIPVNTSGFFGQGCNSTVLNDYFSTNLSINDNSHSGGGGGYYGGGCSASRLFYSGQHFVAAGGSGYCNTSLGTCSGSNGVREGDGYARISW